MLIRELISTVRDASQRSEAHSPAARPIAQEPFGGRRTVVGNGDQSPTGHQQGEAVTPALLGGSGEGKGPNLPAAGGPGAPEPNSPRNRSITDKLRSANWSAEAAIARGSQTWAAYGQSERSYNRSLQGVLGDRTLTDIILSFQTPTHTPVVIDLLAPTGTLRDIETRVRIRGLALGLLDDRKPLDKRIDNRHGLTQHAGNVLRHHPTWDGAVPKGKRKYVDGIHDWIRQQGV